MKIQLLRNENCHTWQIAEKVLQEALKQVGLQEDYEIVVVKNNEEAKKHRFFGSPQITINGKDIDPQAEKANQFNAESCRVYLWQDKMYEYPPKQMILQELKTNG